MTEHVLITTGDGTRRWTQTPTGEYASAGVMLTETQLVEHYGTVLPLHQVPCVPAEPDSVALWCAHLPGDTVIPTVDEVEAETIAGLVNDVLRAINTGSPFEAQPTAHACSWPWDTDWHQQHALTAEQWTARG